MKNTLTLILALMVVFALFSPAYAEETAPSSLDVIEVDISADGEDAEPLPNGTDEVPVGAFFGEPALDGEENELLSYEPEDLPLGAVGDEQTDADGNPIDGEPAPDGEENELLSNGSDDLAAGELDDGQLDIAANPEELGNEGEEEDEKSVDTSANGVDDDVSADGDDISPLGEPAVGSNPQNEKASSGKTKIIVTVVIAVAIAALVVYALIRFIQILKSK